MVTNSSNELEFQRKGRGPIPLTEWNKKDWKREIKKHINDDLLKELHEAVATAYDEEGYELEPRRKDMVGFPEYVDRQATMAIVKNKLRKRPTTQNNKENVWGEVDLDHGNLKHMATLQSIMAGSIRPNARLAKSHGLTPKCRCGADKEDSQHVFNECKDHAQIRDKYDKLIQKVARQDGETQEHMLKVLESKTFQNCGITPECEKLIR